MLPTQPANNPIDRRRINTVLGCKPRASVLPALKLSANLPHLSLGQRRHVMGFSSGQPLWVDVSSVAISPRLLPTVPQATIPTLRQHVEDVISLRTREQVAGIAARRVVASVENVQFHWKRSVPYVCRETMRPNRSATSPTGEQSVVAFVPFPQPRPARIFTAAGINHRPEDFDSSWRDKNWNTRSVKIKGHCSLLYCGATVGDVPASPGHSVVIRIIAENDTERI